MLKYNRIEGISLLLSPSLPLAQIYRCNGIEK